MGNLSFIYGCNTEGIEDNFGSIPGGKHNLVFINSGFFPKKFGKGIHPKIKHKINKGEKQIQGRKVYRQPNTFLFKEKGRLFFLFSDAWHSQTRR
jgi:hypothetical protein